MIQSTVFILDSIHVQKKRCNSLSKVFKNSIIDNLALKHICTDNINKLVFPRIFFI